MEAIRQELNYWLSRRPKYNLEQIFRIAQNYILDGKLYEAYKCLRLAIKQGHEEAQFLNNLFETHGTSHYDNGDQRLRWAHRIFGTTDDPRALKYQVWFAPDPAAYPLLELAESGEPMMQYLCGEYYVRLGLSQKETIFWYQQAAEQNFGKAALALANISKDKREVCKLVLKAAELGYPCNTSRIDGLSFREELSLHEKEVLLAKFESRRSMIKGCATNGFSHILRVKIQQVNNKRNPQAIREVFVIGQEFDGFELYYPQNYKSEALERIKTCIAIYRKMTNLARETSIQTILALRKLRVVKDIAILIAKVVYSTRSQHQWYRNIQT